MKRALIGVDGNCGFALLGENLQEGESEFVEIEPVEVPEGWNKSQYTPWCRAADRAAGRALHNLRVRLGATDRTNRETWITYALDSSHPRSV